MPATVAVLDADVLVPIVACDFLLTAFDLQIYEPVVSSTALEEIERNLIEDFPHVDSNRLRRRVAHMRAALADQIINTEMIEDVPSVINAKDHHVVAAALAAAATIVVTNDDELRSEIAASGLDLAPLDEDSFVMRLWEASSADVSAVIDALSAKRRRRPVSASDMVKQLRVHFPTMADAWFGAQGGPTTRPADLPPELAR